MASDEYHGLLEIVEEVQKEPSNKWTRTRMGNEIWYSLRFRGGNVTILKENNPEGSSGYTFSYWERLDSFKLVTYDFRTENNPIKQITDKLDQESCSFPLKKCRPRQEYCRA